jgi:putative membrane-bound dehydrogenase-like protein
MSRANALLAVSLVGAWCASPTATAEPAWEPLITGKDLAGWYTYIDGHGPDADPDRLIQVHEGVIHAYKDATADSPQPHGYLSTKREYSHYRLRLQYKWGAKRFAPREAAVRDAGIMYHVVGKDAHKWGVWPMSVECQIQEGDTGDLITVDTRCTSWIAPPPLEDEYPTFLPAIKGGEAFKNTLLVHASKVADRREGWNDVEVVVRGAKEAIHIVNGEVVQRLAEIERPDGDKWRPLGKGRIVLQIEGAEILYRNVEIQPLPSGGDDESAPNPLDSPGEAPPADVNSHAVGVEAITVPEGMEVVVAAEAPLINHPMMACLDDRGRLFISESDGVNRESVDDILKARPHSLLMLEDKNADGDFDSRTVFAEGLVQPNGAQWYDGALYVCSAPYVWRFRDTDGDGKADEQTRVAGKFNFDGMSSAFHGPVLGPDGRMYWSGGQHGWKLEHAIHKPWASDKAGAGGPDADLEVEWTHRAPGAFSSWPDGSDPQAIGHGGLANPVETTFSEEGEVFGTIAVFDYVENQRRDAVVHWTEGAIYNLKEHLHPGLLRTGGDLVPVSYRGHAAPAGLTRYRSEQLGEQYRDNYFVAEFNTHRVYRLQLRPSGATFKSDDEVFLESSDPDSHFTDVVEDADGSLLVVNTGGWFLHGCPTSHIAKQSILGAIYRVRRKGHATSNDPRGLQLPWNSASAEQLTAWIDDSRFAVRDRAIHELSQRGDAALEELDAALASDSVRQRRQVVWALNRIRSDGARKFVRQALSDESLSVRLAAIRSVTLHRDAAAASALVALLASESPAEIRAAASALGSIDAADAAEPLLRLLAAPRDRSLEHAILIALVHIGEDAELLEGLASSSLDVRRGCLIALNHMGSDRLTRDAVASALESGDPALFEAALDVLSSHAEWSDQIVDQSAAWIDSGNLSADQQSALRGVVRAFADNEALQEIIGRALSDASCSDEVRILLLDALGYANVERVPDVWIAGLVACLDNPRPAIVSQAIATITRQNLDAFDEKLAAIALAADQPNELRRAAAAAVARRASALPQGLFEVLVKGCNPDVASVDRITAAQALGGARLTSQQLVELAEIAAEAGPLELSAILHAFENGGDSAAGTALLAALKSSPGLDSVTAPALEKALAGYPGEVQASAAHLLKRLREKSSHQSERLERLVNELSAGDAVAGREVFFGSRANCATCHRVGSEGGLVGPNLSQIGKIRARRDLIESVVFPSSSFVREFEPYIVMTVDGKTYSGIISRQSPQTIYLRTADRNELRIERSDIEDMRLSAASIMPQGLDATLSEQELADLIGFLESLKQSGN